MKVDLRVKKMATAGVDVVSKALGDMAVAEMLAHNGAVLGSAKPWSLLRRGHDWVNSTRSLSSNSATVWLMYSEPLSA